MFAVIATKDNETCYKKTYGTRPYAEGNAAALARFPAYADCAIEVREVAGSTEGGPDTVGAAEGD